MTLAAEEFMRRFLLHVLPDRFHRIRHYGLLANATRKQSLALARALLHQRLPQVAPAEQTTACGSAPPLFVCRHCCAAMTIVETFPRPHRIRAPPGQPAPCTPSEIARRSPRRASLSAAGFVALCLAPWKSRPLSGSCSRNRSSSPATRQASRYVRPNRRYRRLLQQRCPSSNRHSASPLPTTSAPPAVSSLEAWSTPTLHAVSGACAFPLHRQASTNP